MGGGKIKMIRPDFREFQGQGVNELLHYGMPRRSGRYPYGSGDRPYQGESFKYRSIDNKLDRLTRKERKIGYEKQSLQAKKYKNSSFYKRVVADQKIKKDYENAVLELSKRNPRVIETVLSDFLIKRNTKDYHLRDIKGTPPHGWDEKTWMNVKLEDIMDEVEEIKKDISKNFDGYFLRILSENNAFRREVEKILTEDSKSLSHSAKGSTWEDHKYVKKIDGVYYYPVGYEDGPTIDELTSKNRDDKKEEKDSKSTKEKIDQVKYHFDEYLKERDIDWGTLPKEEVDAVQRTIARLLESGESVVL